MRSLFLRDPVQHAATHFHGAIKSIPGSRHHADQSARMPHHIAFSIYRVTTRQPQGRPPPTVSYGHWTLKSERLSTKGIVENQSLIAVIDTLFFSPDSGNYQKSPALLRGKFISNLLLSGATSRMTN
jgi:hypothetical protein